MSMFSVTTVFVLLCAAGVLLVVLYAAWSSHRRTQVQEPAPDWFFAGKSDSEPVLLRSRPVLQRWVGLPEPLAHHSDGSSAALGWPASAPAAPADRPQRTDRPQPTEQPQSTERPQPTEVLGWPG